MEEEKIFTSFKDFLYFLALPSACFLRSCSAISCLSLVASSFTIRAAAACTSYNFPSATEFFKPVQNLQRKFSRAPHNVASAVSNELHHPYSCLFLRPNLSLVFPIWQSVIVPKQKGKKSQSERLVLLPSPSSATKTIDIAEIAL